MPRGSIGSAGINKPAERFAVTWPYGDGVVCQDGVRLEP
jgi:hypothetical protein